MAIDHVITPDDAIGKGSPKTKARQNIAAIKILKQLKLEERHPDPDERQALAKYVGWGGIKQIFDPNNHEYAAEREELRTLLTTQEYDAARRSQLDAHYTSIDIVDSMWAAAQRLGFHGGRVIEPSMGTGNFFGRMPLELRNKSGLFGIELDDTTAQIAKALYPSASIVEGVGYQDVDIRPESFDFAIGNPPFGSQHLFDAKHKSFKSFPIHGFFFAKTLDKLRPGGIMEMVVSRYLLDSSAPEAVRLRKYIASKARLLSAYRLPDTAFKASAETEVVTDVIYLQKLDKGETADDSWINLHEIEAQNKQGESFKFQISNWYQAHPDLILGNQTATGRMYAANAYNVEAPADLRSAIAQAIQSLPENVYQDAGLAIDDLNNVETLVPKDVPVFGYYEDENGVIQQRLLDKYGKRQASAVEFRDAKSPKRVSGMIRIRDALRTLIRKELSETATDKEIELARKQLNRVYDNFVKEFGYINAEVNRRLFQDDPMMPRLEALEPKFDPGVSKAVAKKHGIPERKASAAKADIFTKRGRYPYQAVTSASTAEAALYHSLNEYGGIRPDYMEDIYKKPWKDIRAELGDLIFKNPDGGWETADSYLSGNVKEKAIKAEIAFRETQDDEFQRGMAALKAVFPKDKTYDQISVRIGSYWIPGEVLEQFGRDVLGYGNESSNFKARYVKARAQWDIDGHLPTTEGIETWGTSRMSPATIMKHLANNKAILIKDNVGSSSAPVWVVNEEETQLALAKADEMRKEFSDWIWKSSERRNRLVQIYNENYNTDVPRVYDGSHLKLPGLAPGMEVRPHIKNAIWRALQDRKILLDHVVGAGKTPTIIGTLMEMKRLGIARKPIITVPNHLVRQWRDEVYKFYPGANVLAATEKDFEKSNRQRLFGKIATNDYDLIIVAHTAFGKIPTPVEAEKEIINEQLKELADSIKAAKQERGDRHIIRDMERIQENLENRLKEMLAKSGEKDVVADFSELGIDALAVDEAHLFKNLFYHSMMRNVAGLGTPKGSGRAIDMFVKIRYLEDRYKGKAPIIFATGTPVSNSLVEMYTMQRYLMWQKLREQGLHLLDAWASMYGDVQNVYEVHPSGTGYRLATRFAKFTNLSSLMNLYRSFADIIPLKKLKQQAKTAGKRFPVPKIKGGKPQNIVADRSPLQTEFFGTPQFQRDGDGNIVFDAEPGELEVRPDEQEPDKFVVVYAQHKGAATTEKFDTRQAAEEYIEQAITTPKTQWNTGSILWMFENLARLNKETKGKINALSVTNQARKAGLDYRIIDPSAPDFPGSKVNMAVDNVLRIYKASEADRGTQLIFSDLSTPKSERSRAAVKERYAYVRDDEGNVRRVKATLVAVVGGDSAFLLVKNNKTKQIDVYDGQTGGALGISAENRGVAKKKLAEMMPLEEGADLLDRVRDRYEPLSDEVIQDWKDQHDIEDLPEDVVSNEVTLGDIMALGDDKAFSVYDDIKQKLIDRGIPENEIAFIHDYDTAAKKQDAFKKVREGKIRILLGSTEKMGAGMNVQTRLVGLHHLDAPWRPSDLEQREGRIMRQGNILYERDPDGFEVEIIRYSTRQTYDTRMWQLIEHKAAGIEQLRNNYEGLDEIEEDVSETANAADMKAAASGNPLILEEIRLRNEVNALEAEQRGHAKREIDTQNRLDWLRGAQDRYDRDIQIPLAVKSHAEQFPPLDKDSFVYEIDGRTLTEHKQLDGPLTTAFTLVGTTLKGEQAIGRYRGLDLFMHHTASNTIEVFAKLPGQTKRFEITVYHLEDKFSPSGLITRIDNFLAKPDDTIAVHKEHLTNNLTKLAELEKTLGRPWPKEAQLKETRAKHREVVAKLRKAGGGVSLTPRMQRELDAVIAERTDILKVAETGYTYGDEKISEARRKTRDRKKPAYGQGDLFTASEVPPAENSDEIYGTIAVHTERSKIHIGVDTVETPEQAAHVFASLRKSPYEQFFILALDENKKPIAILRAGIGTIDGASVYPHAVASAVYSVPGVKSIWFSHNHPSMIPEPSPADYSLTKRLEQAFGKDIGVAVEGHVVIGGTDAVAFQSPVNRIDFRIPAYPRRKSVPMLERTLRKSETLSDQALTDPRFAGDIVFSIANNKTGVVFLNNRHFPIAFLPMTSEEMQKLRTGDIRTGAGRLFTAVGRSNAAAAFISIPDVTDTGKAKDIARNMQNALATVEVRPLDVFYIKDGKTQSLAQMGLISSGAGDSGSFYSMDRSTVHPAVGMDVEAVEKVLAPSVLAVNDQVGLQLKVIADQSELPQAARDKIPAGKYIKGYIDNDNTVYIVAGNLENAKDALVTYAHEVIGHLGMDAIVGEEWRAVVNRIQWLKKYKNRRVMELADEVRRRYGDLDVDIETRELLALAAEHNVKEGAIAKLLRKVRAAIRKWAKALGFRGIFSFSDVDIDMLIQGSTRYLKTGKGKRGTARSGIQYQANFSMEDSPYVKRLKEQETEAKQNITQAIGQPPSGPPPVNSMLTDDRFDALYQSIVRRLDPLRYILQDKFIDLKHLQEDVGATEAEDAYMRESIWQGRAGERLIAFEEERIQPLLAKAAETGLTMDDIDQWLHARHAHEANAQLKKINPDRRDNDRLSGMSDAEANTILAQHRNNAALQETGRMVDRINQERIDLMISEGLVTQKEVDAWQAVYEHYVPLKRDEAQTLLPPRGQGFNIRGKESKRRIGSTRAVTNVLANVIAQYESSVVRSEKNRVGKALLNFAKAHADPAWWTVDTVKKTPVVKDGEVQWFNDPREYDNELKVKVDGKVHTITFNESNPVAMRIVAAMKNMDHGNMGWLVRMGLALNQLLSTLNTSWSPEFVISNFARDLQTALYNMTDTQLKDSEISTLKMVPGALKGLRANLRAGKKDSEWAAWAERFRKAGGMTGWIDHYRDIADRRHNLEKDFKRLQEGKDKSKIIKLKKFIEDYNMVVENGIRLAAFRKAIELGASETKAASISKNLTVNFNRRGMAGPTLNAMYLFYNASIQGSVRMLQAVVHSPKGRKIALATIGFAIVLDIMNRALSGDDDDDENLYDALPDHVKARNLIIMGEKEPIFKFPLPWGYNILHVIGQEVGELMTSDRFNPLDSTLTILDAFIEAFNPVGHSTLLQTLAPTVIDPMVQIAENKNWSGLPLKPQDIPFGVETPRYQQHWSSAREVSKAIAKAMNDWTGGDEVRPGAFNISPEWMSVCQT